MTIIILIYEHIDHIASFLIVIDSLGCHIARMHFARRERRGKPTAKHVWRTLRKDKPAPLKKAA